MKQQQQPNQAVPSSSHNERAARDDSNEFKLFFLQSQKELPRLVSVFCLLEAQREKEGRNLNGKTESMS